MTPSQFLSIHILLTINEIDLVNDKKDEIHQSADSHSDLECPSKDCKLSPHSAFNLTHNLLLVPVVHAVVVIIKYSPPPFPYRTPIPHRFCIMSTFLLLEDSGFEIRERECGEFE